MNVLILTRYNNDGGVVTHVISLANELKRAGHKVFVMAPLLLGEKGKYDALTCEFIPVDFETKRVIRVFKLIKRIVKEEHIDVIHSHNRNTSIYAQLIHVFCKIPFVWTLHQNNIPYKGIYKMLTFTGQRTIVVSSELKQFCIDKLDIKNEDIDVIFNGIEEERYFQIKDNKRQMIKDKFGVRDVKSSIICQLSRLEPRKGHQYLISSLERIKNQNFEVLITGNDLDNGEYREELKKQISSLNLSDRIHFVGYVNPSEILSISDVFVLPSENEGQPIATLEAFYMGVPVIRTKSGGYEDMKDYCIGVDYGDTEQLSERICAVIENPATVDIMVKSAKEYVKRECTSTAMMNKVLGVYSKVIK